MGISIFWKGSLKSTSQAYKSLVLNIFSAKKRACNILIIDGLIIWLTWLDVMLQKGHIPLPYIDLLDKDYVVSIGLYILSLLWVTVQPQTLNAVAPLKYGCDLKLDIFKIISRMNILNISYELPQVNDIRPPLMTHSAIFFRPQWVNQIW